MKSVFITFDQAFFERIMALLDRHNCRGFSYWQQVQGRGSKTGEPHYGSHAWPSMCSAIITIIDEAKVAPLLEALHRMDKETRATRTPCFCLEYRTDHLIGSALSITVIPGEKILFLWG